MGYKNEILSFDLELNEKEEEEKVGLGNKLREIWKKMSEEWREREREWRGERESAQTRKICWFVADETRDRNFESDDDDYDNSENDVRLLKILQVQASNNNCARPNVCETVWISHGRRGQCGYYFLNFITILHSYESSAFAGMVFFSFQKF